MSLKKDYIERVFVICLFSESESFSMKNTQLNKEESMKKFLGRFVITLIVISLIAGLGFSSINAANDDNPFTIKQLQEARQNYIKANSKLPVGSTLPGKGLTISNDEPIIPEDVKNTDLYKSGWIKVSVDADGAPLAEYATSRGKTTKNIDKNEAKAYVNTLKAAHSYLKSAISANGISIRDVKDMFIAYNGFSAEIQVTDLAKLFNTFGSGRVHVATLYKINDEYSNALIGAETAWTNPGVDGTGMYVGILDTGVDYTHPDLGGTPGATIYDFPTDKIPAGYSFEEASPYPMDCNGHGTHVAGIIAANGTVQGVAPEAKIVFAKIVLGCEGSAWDTTIAAAFDYMADPDNLDDGPEGTHPPVASINMSFGADNGFVDPTAPDQQAIENCIANGIVISLSAGNDYDSYTHTTGYYPFFPDYATVGSPSVTPNSIAVGASWNTISRYVALKEISSENLYAYTVGSDSNNPVSHLGDNGGAGYPYVYCGLGGFSSDFPASVSGKIALIQRGTYTFSLKIHNAAAAGAIGAIIYNSASGGDSLLTMDTGSETLPAIFIGRTAGLFLQTKATTTGDGTGRIAFSSSYYLDLNNGSLADKMVNFSSWGPPPDLSFKPDITAPGGGIWSTVPIAKESYDDYSGTSMAAPHIAACAALLIEKHPDWTPDQVKTALMNTAELLTDPSSGLPYSPHLMGAGRVNIYNALKNSVTLTEVSSKKPYVALGDIPNYKKTPIKFTLQLSNGSSSSITYNISSTAQNTGILLNSYSLGNIVSTQPSGSITVPVGKTRTIVVTIDTRGVQDWTGSPYGGFPYIEGFVSFVPQSGGVTIHIPYMGFLGNWNDFNEADWQFNPVMDPPTDDPASFMAFLGYAATWPEIYNGDWYLTGIDFYDNLDRNAIAFNPYNYYLETDLWLLRNAQNMNVSIADSRGKIIRTIDSVDQLYKMNWYSGNPYTGAPWWWDGTILNNSSPKKSPQLVPDGLYHLVLTATAPKQFDKGSYDPPQVIDFPVMVDTQDPTVTITGKEDNGNGTTTITWSATDPAPSSGIWGYLVKYSTNGGETYTDDWIPPTENSCIVPNGAEVHVIVFDNANNIGIAITTIP